MSKKKKQNNNSGFHPVSCCWNCKGRYLAYTADAEFLGHRCSKSPKTMVKFDHVCNRWEVQE